MFAVDCCGCLTWDKEFFPNSWLIEVVLKRIYAGTKVAELTYSNRPSWTIVPIARRVSE